MSVGYVSCAACGAFTNCVELTAGLCPACKAERVKELSSLHRLYDKALAAGDYGAAAVAADEVEGYERVWGLRLLAAPSVEGMRRALSVCMERAGGDACGY